MQVRTVKYIDYNALPLNSKDRGIISKYLEGMDLIRGNDLCYKIWYIDKEDLDLYPPKIRKTVLEFQSLLEKFEIEKNEFVIISYGW